MNEHFREGGAEFPGGSDGVDVESLLGRSEGGDAAPRDGYRDRVIAAMEAAATERRHCVALRAVAPAELPPRRVVLLVPVALSVAAIALAPLIAPAGASTAGPAEKPPPEAVDGGSLAADAPADVQRALDLLAARRDRLTASQVMLADATR